MTVHEIIQAWLKDNGYDGLFSPDGGCACETSDLFPCRAEGVEQCEPGYKVPCDPECCQADGDCDWHISLQKPDDAKQ